MIFYVRNMRLFLKPTAKNVQYAFIRALFRINGDHMEKMSFTQYKHT